jgi:hypothetical protein
MTWPAMQEGSERAAVCDERAGQLLIVHEVCVIEGLVLSSHELRPPQVESHTVYGFGPGNKNSIC